MKAIFTFRRTSSDLFGTIYRPYVDIVIYGPNHKARRFTMLIDTGADFTIFPCRVAAILGIDLNQDCLVYPIYRKDGPELVYVYEHLPIEIGGEQLSIPVGFLESNNVPPLLGRHQCLEHFQLRLDQRTVSFER